MTRQTVGRIAAAATIALSLSGCIKLNVDLTLQPDNTIDGTMIVAVNQAILQLSGQDPKALADDLNKQILKGDSKLETVRTEAYSDGTFVGTKITFLDEPITTFNGSSASPSASPTDGTSSSDQLKIVREGDDFVVSGAFNPSASGASLDTSPDASALMTGAQLLVSITFPGEVKTHNGTLKGRTVTWTPKMGEPTEMQARGSALGGSSIPLWLLAAGAAVLLVLLGLLIAWLIIRGRRKAVPAQAQAMAPGFNSPPVMYAPDGNVAAGTIPTAPAPLYGAPVPPAYGAPVPPVEPPA
jgi:hypothetical protein